MSLPMKAGILASAVWVEAAPLLPLFGVPLSRPAAVGRCGIFIRIALFSSVMYAGFLFRMSHGRLILKENPKLLLTSSYINIPKHNIF